MAKDKEIELDSEKIKKRDTKIRILKIALLISSLFLIIIYFILRVVYQQGAFTAVSDGQINLSPNQTAYNAARDALNGWDPCYGAIYYFNPNTATNAWIWSRPHVITIGKHRFCK